MRLISILAVGAIAIPIVYFASNDLVAVNDRSADYAAVSVSIVVGPIELDNPTVSCDGKSSEVLLSWNATRNARSYVVERSVGDAWEAISPQFTWTSYIDMLSGSSSPNYRIMATTFGTGAKRYSNVVNALSFDCSNMTASAASALRASIVSPRLEEKRQNRFESKTVSTPQSAPTIASTPTSTQTFSIVPPPTTPVPQPPVTLLSPHTNPPVTWPSATTTPATTTTQAAKTGSALITTTTTITSNKKSTKPATTTAATSSAPVTKPATTTTATSTTPAPKPPVATTTPTTPLPPPPVISSNTLQWGIFLGNGAPTSLSAFQTQVGASPKIQAIFSPWTDGFPDYVSSVCTSQKTLLIFWENYGFSLDDIIAGKYDSYLQSFSQGATTYKCPVILSLFHEMNGNWDDWDGPVGNNTSAKVIAAWKHVHDHVTASNVKWAWAVNNVSVPNTAANAIEYYYPGDAYVDYVGVDGFNFGNPWQTFGQVFDAAMAKVQKYNKPIYIFSMGSTAGAQKALWITEGLGTHIKTYPNIAGWVWFNENQGSQNWLINSDAASLAAFQAVVK